MHDGIVVRLPYTLLSLYQVLFDRNGCIKRYNNTLDIMREFYEVRLDLYQKRKAYLEGMLSAESLRLDNIARFIMEKIDGTIIVGMFWLKFQLTFQY